MTQHNNKEWKEELKKKDLWEISVSGYGSFIFIGTEEQAEEMREHKAEWEAGVGKKERITRYGIDDLIINDDGGTTGLSNYIERFVIYPAIKNREKEILEWAERHIPNAGSPGKAIEDLTEFLNELP